MRDLLNRIGLGHLNLNHPMFGRWVLEAQHKLKTLHNEYTRRVLKLLQDWAEVGQPRSEKELIRELDKITREVFGKGSVR